MSLDAGEPLYAAAYPGPTRTLAGDMVGSLEVVAAPGHTPGPSAGRRRDHDEPALPAGQHGHMGPREPSSRAPAPCARWTRPRSPRDTARRCEHRVGHGRRAGVRLADAPRRARHRPRGRRRRWQGRRGPSTPSPWHAWPPAWACTLPSLYDHINSRHGGLLRALAVRGAARADSRVARRRGHGGLTARPTAPTRTPIRGCTRPACGGSGAGRRRAPGSRPGRRGLRVLRAWALKATTPSTRRAPSASAVHRLRYCTCHLTPPSSASSRR